MANTGNISSEPDIAELAEDVALFIPSFLWDNREVLFSSTFCTSRTEVPAKFDDARPTMNRYLRHVRPLYVRRAWEIRVVVSVAVCSSLLAAASALASVSSVRVCAQQPAPTKPVVVQ